MLMTRFLLLLPWCAASACVLLLARAGISHYLPHVDLEGIWIPWWWATPSPSSVPFRDYYATYHQDLSTVLSRQRSLLD
ncbi:hypothetical protein B0H11DRAFT_1963939 [Mycena galericulata]|nr:hypothetical protein B0H11DRAFT_1963939 [Mycena galericulata]